MQKRHIALGTLSVIIGFSVAWVAKPYNSTTRNAGSIIMKSDRQVSTHRNSLEDPASSESSGFIAAYQSAEDYKEKDLIIETLTPQELRNYVVDLLKHATPNGLDWKYGSIISDLIERMMEQDKMSTARWILSLDTPGNRNYLFEEALRGRPIDTERAKMVEWVNDNFQELLAAASALPVDQDLKPIYKTLIDKRRHADVMHAITLSKTHLVDENGRFDFPLGLSKDAVNAGWEQTFEFYKDNWSQSIEGGMHETFDFPPNFDYDAFATAWSTHYESLHKEEGFNFYNPPLAVFEAWSKTNPQKALDYANKYPEDEFSLGDFLDSYQSVASPKELFQVAEEVTHGSSSFRELSEAANHIRSYLKDDEYKQQEFSNWVSSAGQYNIVWKLIQDSLRRSNNDYERLIPLIPAKDRLGLLTEVQTSMSGRYFLDDRSRKKYINVLSSLGHSKEELERFAK